MQEWLKCALFLCTKIFAVSLFLFFANVGTVSALPESLDELVPEEQLVYLAKAVSEKMTHASNQDVVDYYKVSNRVTFELVKTNPDNCYKFLFPSKYGILYKKYYPAWSISLLADVRKKVILSAKINNLRPPTDDEVQPYYDLAFLNLEKKYGENAYILTNILDPNVDKSRACLMWAELHNEILKLPVDRAGVVLRWLSNP